MSKNKPAVGVDEILKIFRLDSCGKKDNSIHGVCSFWNSKSNKLCFFQGEVEEFIKQQGNIEQSAVIIVPPLFQDCLTRNDVTFILSYNPRLSYAEILNHIISEEKNYKSNKDPGLLMRPIDYPESWVSSSATIEYGAKIGQGCKIHDGVFISSHCVIQDNVEILPNSVIGVDGTSHVTKADGSFLRVPQFGMLLIRDDVKIGAQVVICRAAVDETVVSKGCSIGHKVSIGHNCDIDENVFVGAGATVCGSVLIGRNAWLGPGCTVLNKIQIGPKATIGSGSVVTKNVDKETFVFGSPAKPIKFGTFHNRRVSTN